MSTTIETHLVRALRLAHGAAREEVKAAWAARDEAYKDGHSHVDHETRKALCARLDTAHDRLAVLDEVYAAALADEAHEPSNDPTYG